MIIRLLFVLLFVNYLWCHLIYKATSSEDNSLWEKIKEFTLSRNHDHYFVHREYIVTTVLEGIFFYPQIIVRGLFYILFKLPHKLFNTIFDSIFLNVSKELEIKKLRERLDALEKK